MIGKLNHLIKLSSAGNMSKSYLQFLKTSKDCVKKVYLSIYSKRAQETRNSKWRPREILMNLNMRT